MIRHSKPTRHQLTAIAAVLALVGTAFLLWQGSVQGAGKETAGKFTEELVNVQSEDGIPNGGVIFAPSKDSAKRIAVIWIHGWGVNFYQPTYVKIGRGCFLPIRVTQSALSLTISLVSTSLSKRVASLTDGK